jgi:putative ABC transport system permease protein
VSSYAHETAKAAREPTPEPRTAAAAWLLGVRDVQQRRRRFAIGVAAAALVIAITFLLTGIRATFDNEIARTVSGFAADSWVEASDTLGPFSSAAAFPADRVAEVRRMPGVTRAEPIAVVVALSASPAEQMVNLIGVVPGGLGKASGQAPASLERGSAVVDDALGLRAGGTVTINGRRLPVDGTVEGRSLFAGLPNVYVAMPVVQALGLNGRPLATGIVVQGGLDRAPAGLTQVGESEVRRDLGRTVVQARSTIALVRTLLWVVAAGIIGAIVYMSAVERVRDFAVLKAIGVSGRTLLIGLAMESALLALAAVALGIVIELAIAPLSPMAVEIPPLTYVVMPIGAPVVGVLASAAAIRRALGTDPALAFGT